MPLGPHQRIPSIAQIGRRPLVAFLDPRHGCHLFRYENAILSRPLLLRYALQGLLTPGQSGEDILDAEAPVLGWRISNPMYVLAPGDITNVITGNFRLSRPAEILKIGSSRMRNSVCHALASELH